MKSKRFAGFCFALLSCLLLASASAAAHPERQYDCAGHDEAVLGDMADRAAMELVAWVLETDCLFDSGDRSDPGLPAATRDAYDGHSVVVVGGGASVPGSKLAGLLVVERLWGENRLDTMRVVVAWADRLSGHKTAAFF